MPSLSLLILIVFCIFDHNWVFEETQVTEYKELKLARKSSQDAMQGIFCDFI
jgi:hypothetical protein